LASTGIESAERRFWRALWDRLRVPTWVSYALLAVTVAVNASLQPFFFTLYNIQSNLNTFVPLVAAAVGQTLVILGGGIDLSLGAIITLVDVVVVTLMEGSMERVPMALLAGLAVGGAAGLINGLLVAYVRLQPIVATFATSFVWSGLALWVMPRPGGAVPRAFYRGYRDVFLGVPVAAWIILGIILLWLIIKRHRITRYILAVGGDERAAYASGVPVTKAKVMSYLLGGLFAGLAGLGIVANTASGDPYVGGPITLQSITAVVIGGTRLSGGAGGAGGSIAGAMILSLIGNIVFFANVGSHYQELINGAIVVLALALAGIPALRRRSA